MSYCLYPSCEKPLNPEGTNFCQSCGTTLVGKTIATGSDDKTVKIWNLRTGEEVKTLTGHSGEVFAVAFSPDGKTLLSASADKTIKIWRLSP